MTSEQINNGRISKRNELYFELSNLPETANCAGIANGFSHDFSSNQEENIT
jgi:hypothetical protein